MLPRRPSRVTMILSKGPNVKQPHKFGHMRIWSYLIAIGFSAGLSACAAPVIVGVAGVDAAVSSQIKKGQVEPVSLTAEIPQSHYFDEESDKSFGKADRAFIVKAVREVLDYGQPGTQTGWINPDNGHWGTLTVVRDFPKEGKVRCRDIAESVTIAGETRTSVVTACQKPDSAWRIEHWTSPRMS